jgi:hypothetical protein
MMTPTGWALTTVEDCHRCYAAFFAAHPVYTAADHALQAVQPLLPTSIG